MNYSYGDNTILHSIKFDFFKLENIFKYGIVSNDYAQKNNIPYSKTYNGYNENNYISMVRYIYVSDNDPNSSYEKHILNGISLIVEDTPFISNTEEIYFNHFDEVYVKDNIPLNNIKGIDIPKNYLDKKISSLPIIRITSYNYSYIKKSCDNIVNYLKQYNYNVDLLYYNMYLTKLYNINNLYRINKNEELREDFKNTLIELNELMAYSYEEAFKKVLHKTDVTLLDAINYLNNKYLKLPIYTIKDKRNLER